MGAWLSSAAPLRCCNRWLCPSERVRTIWRSDLGSESPPPLFSLVQGAKVRKHGFAVFGQARVTARHVPRNTCCRHKPTLPLHDCKRVSNTPAYTPEHKSTWNYSYTNTAPVLTLPAACTEPQTTFSVGLEPQKKQTMVQKKAQKCGNTGSPCLDKGQGTLFIRSQTMLIETPTRQPMATRAFIASQAPHSTATCGCVHVHVDSHLQR